MHSVENPLDIHLFRHNVKNLKKFYKNAKKHLQHRETCVIIRLGCGRLVQINKLRKPRYALMREVAAT